MNGTQWDHSFMVQSKVTSQYRPYWVLSTVVDSNNGISLGILLPAGNRLVNWGIANSHRNHAPDYAQHSLGCCLILSLSLFRSFFDEVRKLN